MGLKPQILVPIKQPDLSMPRPIKLIREVPTIIFSHISIIVAIISLILFPYFLETVNSTVERLKKSVISLVIWIHRTESNYPYNPKKDVALQTKLRKLQKEENPPSWPKRVEEGLRMCKKAVIGEDIENNDKKNEGIEDYLFSIFNLHISSVGAEIGIIIILVIMY